MKGVTVPEETNNIEPDFKPTNGSSKFFGVTVKDWSIFEIVTCVCLIAVANFVMSCFGVTSTNFTIPEPLYSGFMLVLGYLFGKLNQTTK